MLMMNDVNTQLISFNRSCFWEVQDEMKDLNRIELSMYVLSSTFNAWYAISLIMKYQCNVLYQGSWWKEFDDPSPV